MNNKTTNDFPDEPVCELSLCETVHLVLKPNQIYIFRVDHTCPTCVKLNSDPTYTGTTK